MGGAEGNEGRDVERAHANDVELAMVGRETQLTRIGVGEGRLRLDVGRRQKRRGLVQDPALRQGQDQLLVGFATHDLCSNDANARRAA